MVSCPDVGSNRLQGNDFRGPPPPLSGEKHRTLSMPTITVILVLLAAPLDASPLQQDTLPSDTYLDSSARSLVESAMRRRSDEIEGIESYEAQFREHIYVGLSGLRFRRSRTLFQQQRVARFRWTRDGEHVIRWEGARQFIPFIGGDAEGQEALQEALLQELLANVDPPGLVMNPGEDAMSFGDNWALHPLSDTAAYHYRFRAGDTLQVSLPDGRVVTMAEVRIEPREVSFNLVAGSIWIEPETGALVRASFKPSRPFNLEMDEPEDAEEVPGILKPIEVEIAYITVDYSLQDFRWWLPRRFAMELEARVGRILRLPITVEGTVSDYRVNETETPLSAGGPLPPGWTRTERRVVEEKEGREEVSYYTIIIPPIDSLLVSPELVERPVGGSPVAFSDREIDQLRRELESLLPSYATLSPSFKYGFQEGMLRFNRVEGLSAGVGAELPITSLLTIYGEARLGVANLHPNGELSIIHGPTDRRTSLTGYRRLAFVSDWANHHSLGTSLLNLVTGDDRGLYYRTQGVELARTQEGRSVRREFRLFLEEHGIADRETSFHLFKPLTHDTLPSNILAREGTVYGGAGILRWQAGQAPGLIASGVIRAEVTGGDFAYQRALATIAVTRPLFAGLAGAMEAGIGAAWGDLPIQRNFFLGGPYTIRGLENGSVAGESFWMVRGEVGGDMPAARMSIFSDVGWAGARDDLGFNDPYWTIGVGFSLLDGMIRLDFGWPIRRIGGSRAEIYTDGIF